MADVQTSASESKVIAALKAVFENKGQDAPELAPDTLLDGRLGLESIDFAELVVRLEQEFGKDPFAADTVPQVSTVHDLAALYD